VKQIFSPWCHRTRRHQFALVVPHSRLTSGGFYTPCHGSGQMVEEVKRVNREAEKRSGIFVQFSPKEARATHDR